MSAAHRGLALCALLCAAEWRPLIARADDIVTDMKAGRMRVDPAAGQWIPSPSPRSCQSAPFTED